uniref:Acetylcholinesterase collagenic tail peptide-like n=1 Tax=Saccoglossus kowalevskii TaxID=10224 RepID=A0ABM0MMG3_SACKO|nr:PREDICTED: acetylcholinesterase collagenic tail peptide-like [Saccoglossus kowalevskii]
MNKITDEGKLAYCIEDKQLYLRDNTMWRIVQMDTSLISTQSPGNKCPPCKESKPICGNGIAEDGEECDDGNEDVNDSCIACRRSYCGDGFRQVGVEECDGTDFNGNTCTSLNPGVVVRGRLYCSNACKIDTRWCYKINF